MPFVYIINKSNGNGTMSDNEGRFSLNSSVDDTLMLSYIGYLKHKVPVKDLRPNNKGEVTIALIPLPIQLEAVSVTDFKIKAYERAYMNDIIEKSQLKALDYVASPISALYMQYSKEGKQIRKLAQIFEEVLTEEQVQKKLSRELLVKLTKDENIDYEAFRKYCYYISDQYIIAHDGAELYSRVMECYKRWTAERNR
jgi:hypothetical protein